jgi:2-methylcitrate dehydratase
MAKNLRFGLVSYDAILSCLLAKRGFTGPVRVVDGENGICDVLMNGGMDLERMADFSGWRILATRFKSMCANGSSQGHVFATLGIVKENDLKPEDIASVRIGTGLRESRHTTSLSKKYPRNAESADHSAFYANAVAIKERHFGPAAMEAAKFDDPVILDLIERMTVEPHPSISEHGSQGISEIVTKDGRKFVKRVDVPYGFVEPLTDKELEEKFAEMARKHFSDCEIANIFKTIWDLEQLSDVSVLMAMMVKRAQYRTLESRG